MNNTEKISISSLDLYYTDFKALKNINLKIPENHRLHRPLRLRQIHTFKIPEPHE